MASPEPIWTYHGQTPTWRAQIFGRNQAGKVRHARGVKRRLSITGKLEARLFAGLAQPVVAQRHSVAKIGDPQNVQDER